MTTTTQCLRRLHPAGADAPAAEADRRHCWRELLDRVLPERVLALLRRGSCRPWEEREIDLYVDAFCYVMRSIERGNLLGKHGDDVRKLIEWKKGRLARRLAPQAEMAGGPGDGLDGWPDRAPDGLAEALAQTVEISRLLLRELTAGQRNLIRWHLQGKTGKEVEALSGLGRRALEGQWARIATIWGRVADGLPDDSLRLLAGLFADLVREG
jgi:hypothetical protein